MLELPTLKGIEAVYRTGAHDRDVARLALVAAGPGPIAQPRRSVQSLEVDVLHHRITAWLMRQNSQLEIFQPAVHMSVGQFRHFSTGDGAFMLWFGVRQPSLVGPIWNLEAKWKRLEAEAPGLAPAALLAIDKAGRCSFPLYVPSTCEYYASWCWWHGCDDESETLEEYRSEIGKPDAPAPDTMITREKFDKALPRTVTRPRTPLSKKALGRLANRGGVRAEISRLVIELLDDCAASRRARNEPEMEYGNDDGMIACEFAAALRWNSSDPMLQAYDDYVNEHANAVGVEECFGWYAAERPDELAGILRALERRYRIAAKVEKLLPLIGTRWNPQ